MRRTVASWCRPAGAAARRPPRRPPRCSRATTRRPARSGRRCAPACSRTGRITERGARAADAGGAGACRRRRGGADRDPHPAAAGGGRHVSKLYLIIDANPSPIAAIFSFTPESGRADIETRVRVDDYSHVRAIAETSDGQLHHDDALRQGLGRLLARRPARTPQAALATLGQMRFRVDGDLKRPRAGARAAADQPPQPLGPGDGPGDAPVHAGALRAQVDVTLRRQAGAVGRRRLLDQREPELPLLLRAAGGGRAEGRRWSTRTTCASSPRRRCATLPK